VCNYLSYSDQRILSDRLSGEFLISKFRKAAALIEPAQRIQAISVIGFDEVDDFVT
jgi:hypothetical protein